MTINYTAFNIDFSTDTAAEFTQINDLIRNDGTLGWCTAAGASHGIWALDKTSTFAVNGVTVVATSSGTGRWSWVSGGSAASPSMPFVSALLYGAVADARHVTDGAITSPTTALTSATAAWTSADVGKSIRVQGAGAAGIDLLTTIAAFVSPTAVTLTAASATTVSAANVVWGTNNTTPFQTGLDALDGTGVALWIPDGGFVVAGPITVPNNSTILGTDGTVIWAMILASGVQTRAVTTTGHWKARV